LHYSQSLTQQRLRNCVGDVRATCARRADGRIDVDRCPSMDGRIAEARGIARMADTRTSAKLKIRFAPAAQRTS
jgi:lipocalin